ncbi:hypothetical protein Pmani_014237 [Petrolisthes manimaculis]|uniref:Uncharacterized protein n=1 Tax=Petrolisthes manimaculis TaxID=1843537 RepID=A0AAE1PWU5_9EUCA|nr:hypothetical protein Pmani_014237 [Petrolisthes manimaculis]
MNKAVARQHPPYDFRASQQHTYQTPLPATTLPLTSPPHNYYQPISSPASLLNHLITTARTLLWVEDLKSGEDFFVNSGSEHEEQEHPGSRDEAATPCTKPFLDHIRDLVTQMNKRGPHLQVQSLLL